MITYRLLSAADLITLHECFLAAFSDYEVDMQMSLEQFQQRILRDGVRLEMSAGAFDEKRMIGFYMNATGMWQRTNTAYDSGTGVIPDYRRKGIGQQLFEFIIPQLKANGIDQYLLEVLCSNESAVALYRKLGFVETRVLDVFRATEPPADVRADVVVRRVEKPDWDPFQSFWDSYPSWQNSIDAVERIKNERIIVAAYAGDSCVGYGVLFQPAASLMQLAVAREHRRKGAGSKILAALQSEVSEVVKVNNIDESLQGTRAFFEANGFKLVLKQFEMLKNLTDSQD